MFYLYTVCTIILSILFSGCSASKQDLLSNSSKKSTKPVSKSNYISKSGYYFALIEKSNNTWKIVDIKDTPIEKRVKRNQEILRIDETYDEVILYFTKSVPINKSNIYSCSALNNENRYTPCTSSLTSDVPMQNIVDIIKSLNFESTKDKYIDNELINKAIKETYLFVAIESKKSFYEYGECENLFRQAKTEDDFNAFIEKYSYFQDAQQLIALAIQNRDAMISIAIERKNKEEKKRKEEEQLAKANEQKMQQYELESEKRTLEIEKLEQKVMQNFAKNIEKFRKTLKSGVDTNCGKIIETKDSSVKVRFNVKDYGSEHWIDSNKIFPKDHGCRFVKGNYIAPASF